MKRILSLLAVVLILAGCGGTSSVSLEEYLSENEDVMTELKASLPENVDCTVSENTVIYTCDMGVRLDDATAGTYSKSLEENLGAELDKDMPGNVKELERNSGINGLTIRVIYADSKGKEIYTVEYDSKGRVKE